MEAYIRRLYSGPFQLAVSANKSRLVIAETSGSSGAASRVVVTVYDITTTPATVCWQFQPTRTGTVACMDVSSNGKVSI